jgi:hypothetical protein
MKKKAAQTKTKELIRRTCPSSLVVLSFLLSTLYPLYDFDLRATHARALLPAASSFCAIWVYISASMSSAMEVMMAVQSGTLFRALRVLLRLN